MQERRKWKMNKFPRFTGLRDVMMARIIRTESGQPSARVDLSLQPVHGHGPLTPVHGPLPPVHGRVHVASAGLKRERTLGTRLVRLLEHISRKETNHFERMPLVIFISTVRLIVYLHNCF